MKYLKLFERLSNAERALFEDQVKLKGNVALVEKLPKEEIRTKGGLFLGDSHSTHVNTAYAYAGELGVILMTSGKERDFEGNLIESDLQVGQIVLLPGAAVTWYSQFPLIPNYTGNSVGLILNHQLKLSFKSMEGYKQLKDIFAKRMEEIDAKESNTDESSGDQISFSIDS